MKTARIIDRVVKPTDLISSASVANVRLHGSIFSLAPNRRATGRTIKELCNCPNSPSEGASQDNYESVHRRWYKLLQYSELPLPGKHYPV